MIFTVYTDTLHACKDRYASSPFSEELRLTASGDVATSKVLMGLTGLRSKSETNTP